LEKEEKERKKAEEKELDRQAKQKRKEADAARKENYKRQEDDLAARYKNAGKAPTNTSSSNTSSRAEDDDVFVPPGAPVSRPSGLGLQSEERELATPPTSHPRENGAGTSPAAGNMLHRFRNTSMSMSFRQKPRFWSKEKDKDKGRRSEELSVREPTTPEEQLNEGLLAGSGSPELGARGSEKKKESRFGLGRKKSVNLLSRNH